MFMRRAAYLLASISAMFARDYNTPVSPEMVIIPNAPANLIKRKGKLSKVRGKTRRVRLWPRSLTYPHSSKRQQARYARQMAAGQLHFMPVHGVPDRSAA